MNVIKISVVVGLAAFALAGCRQWDARRGSALYVENGDMISGHAHGATMYDLDSATQSLMRRLRENETFRGYYAQMKDRKVKSGDKGHPLIAIGRIVDLTDQGVQPRMDSIRNEVSTSIYESGLFHVRDDAEAMAIGDRIKMNMGNGLEDGALKPVLRHHPSPDYVFLGDFRRFAEPNGYYVYRLHFSVQDLSTGIIAWEGEETVVKFGHSCGGCCCEGSPWHRYRHDCGNCGRFACGKGK